MHTHPYLFTLGAAVIGFLVPEWFIILAKGKVSVPLAQNIITAIAFGLIAAAFAF